MTPEFYQEYLQIQSRKRKVQDVCYASHLPCTSLMQLLYVMNPNKFRACQVRPTCVHTCMCVYRYLSKISHDRLKLLFFMVINFHNLPSLLLLPFSSFLSFPSFSLPSPSLSLSSPHSSPLSSSISLPFTHLCFSPRMCTRYTRIANCTFLSF